jgi:DNA primase
LRRKRIISNLGNVCDTIKENADIYEFCENYFNCVFIPGVSGWYNTNCVFPDHNDTNPSFGINPDKGTFNCFGCGRKGSIIDLVMHTQNISLSMAIKFLLDYLSLDYDSDHQIIYNINRLLSQSSSSIDRSTLLDAKIKSLKSSKENVKKYYRKVCDAFDNYEEMDDDQFQQYVYNS